mgnify:CR=1 FL=1
MRFSEVAAVWRMRVMVVGVALAFGPVRGADAAGDWAAVRAETFATVWQTVNDSYVDPAFGGVNWKAVKGKYEAQLEQVPGKAELRTLLQAMLAELQKTHFAIFPRETAVAPTGERASNGAAGVELTVMGREVVIARVKTGSPAAAAGLKPGDAVRQIGDRVVEEVAASVAQSGLTPAAQAAHLANFVASRLRGPVGATVPLVVAAPAAEDRPVNVALAAVKGVWSEPVGNFPAQLIESVAERGADGIGYLKFNIFVSPFMRTIRPFLLKLKPGDGLVIDLRGNPGGVTAMAPGICGWLVKEEFSLGKTRLRKGFMNLVVTPQAGAFLGPVAVLIDSGSASTSEILAAGLQEAGRARVFGGMSAGAALPSLLKTLPSGDVFQYAVADLQTPRGRHLEGVGVTPDERVAATREDLVAGRDPVLAAARAWLEVERKKGPAARAGKS